MRKRTVDLQSVVDAQDQPAVIIDESYHIVAANRAYCESYGVDSNQVIGRHCHEVSHRSSVPCHLNGEACPHQQVLNNAVPFQVLHTHFDADNNPDYVRIKAYPLADGASSSLLLMECIHRLASPLDISCEDMRMVGTSPAFLSCIEHLTVAARTGGTVLIDGETGAGKELAARFVHEQSSRASGPYIELNCAALPDTLVEDELFGHERGAFTGSTGSKPGLFEQADGGTMFLDEIGDMPLAMQSKLLRVLDSGQFRRIGGHRVLSVDVRVVAATNRDLWALVDRGEFREDLYYRIAGIRVTIPPLRERRADILPLAQLIIRHLAPEGAVPPQLSKEAAQKLEIYDYPGNIRQLRNILQKAVAICRDGIIQVDDLQLEDEPGLPSASPSMKGQQAESWHRDSDGIALTDVEARHIARLLRKFNGNRRKVASALKISERTLYRKINQYGLRNL